MLLFVKPLAKDLLVHGSMNILGASSIPSILQNSKIQYTLPQNTFHTNKGSREFCMPIASEDHRKVITISTFESRDSENGFVPYENSPDLQESYPECKTFIIMADGNEISTSWEKSLPESPDVLFERTFAWFQKNCSRI